MSAHLTPEQLEAPGQDAAAHVSGCAQCRDAVRLAAGRQKLLKGVKPYTLADVAFSRVEARLMEHVRDNPPGPRWTFGRVLAFASLAAIAGLFALTTVRPLFQDKPAEVVAAPVVASFQPMTVVHAAKVALKAGQVFDRGASVDATGGFVMLASADGASLRVATDGKVTLAPSAQATLQHQSGTLSVDAKKGGPWVVWTGTHWVRATDAMFEVAPDALKVFRGSVELSDSATFQSARRVTAGSSASWRDGKISSLDAAAKSGLRDTPPPPWAKLDLSLAASEVELDGQQVGGSPLMLLTSVGKHHVRARIGDAWRETDVDLSADGPGVVTLPEKASIIPAMAAVGPQVEADPEAIAAAVKSQLPKLRVCHEKWLKVNEAARGKVLMTVTVSPKGRVSRAKFTADEGVPETVNECLGRAVRAMKLPQSSEEVELEIPVVLGAP